MGFRDREAPVTDGGSAVVIEEQPDESVSQAVIRGISDVKGVPPCDLAPLYESVDPEPLDELLEHSRPRSTDVAVEFTHEGCAVVVRSGGSIRITDPTFRND